MPDFEAYCASQCVDFFGVVAISGQTDLRKVPILPKIRKLYSLDIGVDGLTDLSGLEMVDVTQLHLRSSSGVQSESFKSLNGFLDEDVEIISFNDISSLSSLSSLETLSLKRVVSLIVQNSGFVDLDLSGREPQSIAVQANRRLRSMKLPSTVIQDLNLESNPVLAELAWTPALKVTRSVFIQDNASLSSCAVQQLVSDSAPDGGRAVTTRNNGPCP